ncbi:MAG: discoidin domain-containing protein [Verrucomicrobiota bacterium]
MNAHIRSRGKNCRIWSGFEHMGGSTQIDPSVIIDMWETDDAKGQITKGHSIINSNHGRTYIVPGCHYYGISRGGIYQEWEPWMVSGDMTKNPAKDDPKLLGGKLHVWADQGPTGYTLTEIADTTLSGIQPFAEKLWGTKGSADYQQFTARAAKTLPIPNVILLDRLPAAADGVVLSQPQEVVLRDEAALVPLPLATAPRADLEYPWTLTMDVRRSADTSGRGVLISSELAEICANYSHDEEQTSKDASGKDHKEKVTLRGVGTVRAAGSRTGQGSPAETHISNDVSKASNIRLPLNQWASLTVVGEQGRNTIWLNGEKIAESPNQLVCPLARLGSKTGQSFVGSIRNLRVVNRALAAKEIGRAAGLDIPDNLAVHCTATASASDSAHGLDPANATDENPATRWSSDITKAEQWLAIDLGKEQSFNTVAVTWEAAVPKTYKIQVASDATHWTDVFTGEAQPGKTTATFPTQRARHLRLLMREPKTQWGYSIHEIEVVSKRAGTAK